MKAPEAPAANSFHASFFCRKLVIMAFVRAYVPNAAPSISVIIGSRTVYRYSTPVGGKNTPRTGALTEVGILGRGGEEACTETNEAVIEGVGN
jgi:hypothetical protein